MVNVKHDDWLTKIPDRMIMDIVLNATPKIVMKNSSENRSLAALQDVIYRIQFLSSMHFPLVIWRYVKYEFLDRKVVESFFEEAEN